MIVEPAVIVITFLTLAGLAAWLGFFRPLIVGLFLPVWQRPRSKTITARSPK
jgi:hypothetical protein